MQLKNKHPRDHPNNDIKCLQPSQIKVKLKKNKETQLKSNKPPRQSTAMHKVKHHLPSKSALEMTEHIHYNSPTFTVNNQPENQSPNSFTFTQLLQFSNKNQRPSYSTNTLQQSLHPNINNAGKQGRSEESRTSRTPLSIVNFTPNMVSICQQTELTANDMQFSRVLKQKLSNIRNENSKSEERSQNNQATKSPIKMTNAHRLNNTPKIKSSKQKPYKINNQKELKTFTEMLRSELAIPESTIKNFEDINLECSQKIYKFIRESEQKQKSQKNKSNLLSTGIINLSQPHQNSQQHTYFNKLSKETLTSKVKVNRVIGESNVNEFQSGSPSVNRNFTAYERMQQLKRKIQELSTKLNKNMKMFTEQMFVNEINQNFNPELAKLNISQIIQELSQLNTKFQTYFQSMIHQLQHNSQQIYNDIANNIELIKTSKSSMIDWIEIEKHLQEKSILEETTQKTQIWKLRLQKIEESINIRKYDSCLQEQEDQIEINVKISLQLKMKFNRKLNYYLLLIKKFQPQKQLQGQQVVSIFKEKLLNLKTLLNCFSNVLTNDFIQALKYHTLFNYPTLLQALSSPAFYLLLES